MKKDKKEKKEKKEKRASAPQPVIPWGLGQSSESGGLRYGDLKEKIPGITDMMFSQSLKDLTAQGLIQRTQFQEIPPRVEYALTPEGSSLLPVIASLYDWAVGQMKNS